MQLSPRIWKEVSLTALLTAAVGGMVLVTPPGSAGATATATAQRASSVKHLALEAVAAYRHAGKVKIDAKVHVQSASTISIAGTDGATVAPSGGDMTFGASDGAGSFIVDVAVVQGVQPVVGIVNLAAQTEDLLVLAPGSATISQVVAASLTPAPPGNPPPSGPPGTAAEAPAGAILGAAPGCDVWAAGPSVIGSMFGYLLDGSAGLWCSYPASMNLIVENNEWTGYTVKNIGIAGASGWSTSIGASTFDPCVSGAAWFQTAALAQVNGGAPFGTSDAWAVQYCGLL